MFDNLGTALIQAVGFFSVFGFFVYQLLTDDKKTNKNKSNSPKKQIKELKVINNKPKRKRLFGKTKEPIKEEVKLRKKGLFGRKVESKEILENPKNRGWFK